VGTACACKRGILALKKVKEIDIQVVVVLSKVVYILACRGDGGRRRRKRRVLRWRGSWICRLKRLLDRGVGGGRIGDCRM
jgi:hypothetical protein